MRRASLERHLKLWETMQSTPSSLEDSKEPKPKKHCFLSLLPASHGHRLEWMTALSHLLLSVCVHASALQLSPVQFRSQYPSLVSISSWFPMRLHPLGSLLRPFSCETDQLAKVAFSVLFLQLLGWLS